MTSFPVVTRRKFLRGTLGVIAGVGSGVLLGCEFDPHNTEITIPDETAAYADNVLPPPATVPRDRLGFLTSAEASAVDAFTARLIPGTPEDPGAHEAGVVTFIDVTLATVDGFWEPTYVGAPFVEVYSGSPPPATDEHGETKIFVQESEVDRYGYQSKLTPREIYRKGIKSLDEFSQEQFGAPFSDLSEDAQDEIIGAIADDEAPTFEEPSASLFFKTIRQDTVYGMFADPAYGGNQDLVGWKLIGYPGAQRGYTPEDLQSEAPSRPPQSIADLHAFNPGVDVNCEIVLPVSDENPTNQQVPEGTR